jgi:hypothetical protein
VTRTHDKTAEGRAGTCGYRYVVQDGWELPEERTLFVADGTAVPYGLLEAGFAFLEKWEVAAPLWRYGVLAKDIGTPSERARTEAVALDLRVLLYGHELLFVRRGSDGERFLETWRQECDGGDERLAFLRALHTVKPLFCTLPTTWLLGESQRVAPTRRRERKVFTVAGAALTEVRKAAQTHQSPVTLVQVQIAPGRYVQCRPEEVEMVTAKFADQALSRRERRQRGLGG